MENMKKRQLRLNVEEILDEYVNGMYDDDYPQMTIEECREYVKSQVYDRKAYGNGFTAIFPLLSLTMTGKTRVTESLPPSGTTGQEVNTRLKPCPIL